MAPVPLGRTPTTEQTFRRFSPSASFSPLLLLGFCFEAFYAAIQYIFLRIAQIGMNLLEPDKNLSFSSEVHDGKTVNPYVFWSSKSDLNSVDPVVKRDNRHWITFEGGSMKTNSPFDLRGNSANSDKTSLHGIQNIVPLQANCGNKNLIIMAAKKKKNIGFFQGLGRFIHF